MKHINKTAYVDLGLPSGILWAKNNVKIDNKRHFTHYEMELIGDIYSLDLPSFDDLRELIDECTWKWIVIGKTAGYKVTGPNGNHIFLPASGYYDGTTLNGSGTDGYYWSTTYNYSSYAYYLYFDSSSKGMSYDSRGYGLSIRAVKHKSV